MERDRALAESPARGRLARLLGRQARFGSVECLVHVEPRRFGPLPCVDLRVPVEAEDSHRLGSAPVERADPGTPPGPDTIEAWDLEDREQRPHVELTPRVAAAQSKIGDELGQLDRPRLLTRQVRIDVEDLLGRGREAA
jgi:hypothetical protein